MSVLLARLPGATVTVSDGDYPSFGENGDGDVAPGDGRVAAWLRAPPRATLAWCALFLDGRHNPPFSATPHVATAYPAAAIVGGVASARAGGGAVAVGVAPCDGEPEVREARSPALSIFVPYACR